VLAGLAERGVLAQDVSGRYRVASPHQDVKPEPLERERVAAQLREHLAGQVASGTLRPGQSLPGRRPLAEALGVNANSVQAAIGSLTASRFLVKTEAGRFRIASPDPAEGTGTEQLAAQLREHLAERAAIGDLRPGQSLPGRRALAAALGANPTTVQRALRLLTASRFLAFTESGRYALAGA
jgi:DNA-binding transcriptional regulator YhcF (GntR family)